MFFFVISQLACRSTPDVVLITVDTLRYDHVSSLDDSSPSRTLNIDQLAQDAVRYTNAYSPISVTGPAFTSVLTGQSVASHGVAMNVFRGGKTLAESEITLAERFREQQYATAAFVSGFTLRSSLGLTQGFDRYDANLGGQNRRWGDKTAEVAVQWLKTASEKVFLWYHTYDAHGPWNRWGKDCLGGKQQAEQQNIPKYQRMNGCSVQEYQDRYAKSVEFADQNIGRIVTAFKDSERYSSSMIVLTADHGESFTERELWFDHGTTAHEEQLHVPLIIKYPENREANTTDTRLVSLMDIAPTIIQELRLAPLPKATGRSLVDSGYSGAEYLIGESSHCKDETVLSCAPKGPSGKEYSYRTSLESIFLKGTIWEKYSRQQDRKELHPQSVGVATQQVAAGIFERKRKDTAQMTWLPASDKNRDTEMKLLQSLGYIGETKEK